MRPHVGVGEADLKLEILALYGGAITDAGNLEAAGQRLAPRRALAAAETSPFVSLVDNGANRQGFVIPHMMYDCAATSLFIGIRADNISASFFGAASDIRLRGYLDTVT